jgi:hypothetical protein
MKLSYHTFVIIFPIFFDLLNKPAKPVEIADVVDPSKKINIIIIEY